MTLAALSPVKHEDTVSEHAAAIVWMLAVPRAADEALARRAYVDYVREMRAGFDQPLPYQRWLVEYGYDEDETEERTTVERPVSR